jgi:hypothetical protein
MWSRLRKVARAGRFGWPARQGASPCEAHDLAFSGLIACGHCGYSIVGEIKKQRYVYYHCTGYRGRCDEPYVREEIIGQRFSELLGRLTFDAEVLAWVRDALRASHADETWAQNREAARTRAQCAAIVREARTPRKTSPTQFHCFELHLEGQVGRCAGIKVYMRTFRLTPLRIWSFISGRSENTVGGTPTLRFL